jgi:hypothetical protein
MTGLCVDCITGGHGPNHHRKHLPPPRIVPVEHCGELTPPGISSERTECVLRPGHSGSHADDRGARWWPTRAPDICEIPHQTIEEEEACEQQRLAADPSWSVRCRPPGCNAQPGERCRRRDGSLSTVSHGERWREYDRQKAAHADKTRRDQETRQDQLEATLREVLDLFTPLAVNKADQRVLAYNASDVVEAERVDRWRAVAYPTKDGNK